MSRSGEYERHHEILRLLEVNGRLSVAELVATFGVTAVTIRKDLEFLERRRLLCRVRGGAVPQEGADEGAFEMRLRHRTLAKRAIARAAAQLVPDGVAIALDCSTTCFQLALELRGRNLIVVSAYDLTCRSGYDLICRSWGFDRVFDLR